MTITHTWYIDKLEQLNNNSGIVRIVNYGIVSTDGIISTKETGEIYLNTDDLINPIPYTNLTEEIIIGWVKDRLGDTVQTIENNNTEWILTASNPSPPVLISTKLPWLS